MTTARLESKLLNDNEHNTLAATFKALKLAAEHGDIEAQCLIGECFLTGAGTKPNFGEYERYTRKAADKGNTLANFSLGMRSFDCVRAGDKRIPLRSEYLIAGRCHFRTLSSATLDQSEGAILHIYLGLDIEENSPEPQKALPLYYRAASMGDTYGYYYAARLMRSHNITRYEGKTELEMLMLGVKANNPKAMTEFAFVHRSDTNLAYHFYKRAAGYDLPEACVAVANMLSSYRGKNETISQSVSSDFTFQLYDINKDEFSLDLNNPDLELYWREKAATLGDLGSCSKVSNFYTTKANHSPDSASANELRSKAKKYENLGENITICDYTGQMMVQMQASKGKVTVAVASSKRQLEVLPKLKSLDFTWLNKASQSNPIAARILNLLTQQGITVPIRHLMSFYLKNENSNICDIEYHLERLERQYHLIYTPPMVEAKVRHSKKNKSMPTRELLELALDLNDRKALKKLLRNSTAENLEYIKSVLAQRDKQQEVKVDLGNLKIKAEIERLNQEIENNESPELYAMRALNYIVLNDFNAARQDLFKNVDIATVKNSLVVAAVALMRVYQADLLRALEGIKDLKTPETEIVLAIIAIKAGKFDDALVHVKDGIKAHAVLRDLLATEIVNYVRQLNDANKKPEVLAVFEKLGKQGFNHTKLTKLKLLFVEPKPVGLSLTESVAPVAEKKAKKKKKRPKIETVLGQKVQQERAKILASDTSIKATIIPVIQDPASEVAARADEKSTVSVIPPSVDDKKALPSTVPIKCAQLTLEEKAAHAIKKLKENNLLMLPEDLKAEAKISLNSELSYSLPPIVHKLVLGLEKAGHVKVVGGINRQKVESEIKKAKEFVPTTDIDLVIQMPISFYDIKNICEELQLPTPFLPNKEKCFFQILAAGYKVDILWDPNLFKNPKEAILERGFAVDAITAHRDKSKDNYYVIEDLSKQGIVDVARKALTPLRSPVVWLKEALQKRDSGHWVKLLRLIKSLQNGYKVYEKDIFSYGLMIAKLPQALQLPQIVGHFQDHLGKLFLKGQSVFVFERLHDLAMVKEIFPFLAEIDLTQESMHYQFILESLARSDAQFVLHQVNPKVPQPTVESIYGIFLGVALYQQAAKPLTQYVREQVAKPKDVYRAVNDYFNSTQEKAAILKAILDNTPVFVALNKKKKSGFTVPLEFEGLNQASFRVDYAVKMKEITLLQLDNAVPTALSVFAGSASGQVSTDVASANLRKCRVD